MILRECRAIEALVPDLLAPCRVSEGYTYNDNTIAPRLHQNSGSPNPNEPRRLRARRDEFALHQRRAARLPWPRALCRNREIDLSAMFIDIFGRVDAIGFSIVSSMLAAKPTSRQNFDQVVATAKQFVAKGLANVERAAVSCKSEPTMDSCSCGG